LPDLKALTVYLPEDEVHALNRDAAEGGRSGASAQIRYVLERQRSAEPTSLAADVRVMRFENSADGAFRIRLTLFDGERIMATLGRVESTRSRADVAAEQLREALKTIGIPEPTA
jgi:hypothetical protein